MHRKTTGRVKVGSSSSQGDSIVNYTTFFIIKYAIKETVAVEWGFQRIECQWLLFRSTWDQNLEGQLKENLSSKSTVWTTAITRIILIVLDIITNFYFILVSPCNRARTEVTSTIQPYQQNMYDNRTCNICIIESRWSLLCILKSKNILQGFLTQE